MTRREVGDVQTATKGVTMEHKPVAEAKEQLSKAVFNMVDTLMDDGYTEEWANMHTFNYVGFLLGWRDNPGDLSFHHSELED